MRKNFFLFLLTLSGLSASAQFKYIDQDDKWKTLYRYTDTKINDLVNTRLEVSFDYKKSYLYGKAWITLQPHIYDTDSLRLDAKGMNINKVSLYTASKSTPLQYTYDSLNLRITLDRKYKGGEKYTVYIDYTAKPNELRFKGSAAITDAKGLYFINPLGTDKDKPTQIWTQGETEGSSAWFPTIDRPNQKTTQQISMTVPAKYVTLSNGKMIGSKANTDGTRTDVWKMDLPHAPYLFFMGVGDFAIVKDTYKGKEVNYYIEKEYEKEARKIFGLTPEMMGFFSKLLSFEYPWVKYAQMVGRDFVSGAMENTTATLHTSALQQNARQLTDGNKFEDYVSHELFHQWFGDLVTAESWSNLTVNESFANYSEVLWKEYKHGKDDAQEHNYTDMQTYLLSGSQSKDLVRFHYKNKEDMFDAVSYNKGGRILNMLRNYVGDTAFFRSLNLYLTTNKYKSAEAHQLRLAFEEVTGKDLNWFFNQWYFSNGHPKLEVTYGYDSIAKNTLVYLKQSQSGDKIYQLPMAIDVYNASKVTRYNVWFDKKQDTFSFPVSARPDLVNVDADKVLLAEKTDKKTTKEYAFQYRNAKNFTDRKEALDFLVTKMDEPDAKQTVIEALRDPYYKLRELVLNNIDVADSTSAMIGLAESIAITDKYRTTRAAAITLLGQMNNPAYESMFAAGTTDSSYSIAGASLIALSAINENKAVAMLPKLKQDAKGELALAIDQVSIFTKGDADFDTLTKAFDKTPLFNKATAYNTYLSYLSKVNNTENFKKGVDKIAAFRDVIGGFDPRYKKVINDQLLALKPKKQQIRNAENAKAIDEQLAYLDKVTSDTKK